MIEIVTETDIVPLWLDQRLNPVIVEHSLPGWEDEIPLNQGNKGIVWGQQDASDINYTNAENVAFRQIWRVVVTAEVDWYSEPYTTAAWEMHNLLQGAYTVIPVSGWDVISCERQTPLRHKDKQGDSTWIVLGGIYRIVVQQAG